VDDIVMSCYYAIMCHVMVCLKYILINLLNCFFSMFTNFVNLSIIYIYIFCTVRSIGQSAKSNF